MKIGIDVDGVLTNLEEYQLKYGKKYFKDVKDIDESGYDICDIFHCSEAEREKFWTKYIWKYCLSEPIAQYASEVLARLKAEGHEIHIITGRAHTTEQNFVGSLFRKMLLNKLKEENICYDSIHYCSEKGSEKDKQKICDNLGIDIMLDDKRENIVSLKDKIPVICFDAKYNQGIECDNVYRVNNFLDAYNIIEMFAKQNKNAETFTMLNADEIDLLSTKEKIQYYTQLKEYYKKLPYDSDKYNKQEKCYSKVATFAIPIFNRVFNPKVFNKELVPTDENVIFVSNHLNYYDQFPIISAIGSRPIHFLTSTKMLALKRGYIYKKTGAVSINREDKNDRYSSKEEIIKILLNDGNVFIFPEGKTNRDNKFLNEFHPGAVAIARTTGKKIVPMAVNDNYKSDDGPLCVRFGEPMIIKPTDNVLEKTEELKANIGLLMWENMEYVQMQEKEKKKVR